MNDLRKAAEMALEAFDGPVLKDATENAMKLRKACDLLRQALAHEALDQMVAENQRLGLYDDGPAVKTYAGGKPNYCTPQPEVCCGEYAKCLKVCIPKERWFAQQKLNVDTVNMSQERVDETAKGEHEPVYAFRRRGLDDFCTCDKRRYDELADKPNLFEVALFYTAPPKKEWVGLTDEEIIKCFDSVAFGQVEDDLIINKHVNIFRAIHGIEAKLREKNT